MHGTAKFTVRQWMIMTWKYCFSGCIIFSPNLLSHSTRYDTILWKESRLPTSIKLAL